MNFNKLVEEHRKQYEDGSCHKKMQYIRDYGSPLDARVCALCYYLSWKGVEEHFNELDKKIRNQLL